MIAAKNNIIVPFKNSAPPEYAILNPVSGSFDLMGEKEYKAISGLNDGIEPDGELGAYLLERGYAYDDEQSQGNAIKKAYSEFQAEIAVSQVQLMLVPTYACNLACTYCFQHGIDGRPTLITEEIVDSFFDYARTNFSNNAKKPFITLFGGEPLVNSPALRKIIRYIVDKCVEEDYEIAAVTNGYDFAQYADMLAKARVKEIQFTLDGSRDVHDSRRATANKKGTFDRVIEGIEAAVEHGMPVNLRSVVDAENIEDIVNLAEYLDGKGWLDLPSELFKTQIGRNYELFDCYAKPQHLMTQVELWSEYAGLSRRYPVLSKFHRPDFKGVRHLADTGDLYMASFDTCPACKTEWVFDLYGDIYGCTASCGREEYKLGTFWPEIELNRELVDTWKKRDVTSIPECRDCRYNVICGGGCGVVASNRNGGTILSPDCRPVGELIEIGINHYGAEIHRLADNGDEEDEVTAADTDTDACACCACVPAYDQAGSAGSCCAPAPSHERNLNSVTAFGQNPADSGKRQNESSGTKNTEGCVICGKELVYSSSGSKERCEICGGTFETYVKCGNGHFVCDRCHGLDALGKAESYIISSEEKHPVNLAKKVFGLPGLNMHGPEYHSIVPAVLVAAYQNMTGKKNEADIREAVRRGKEIKGGSCGFYGGCGASLGTGIALSVIERATPVSLEERGAANRISGLALLEISRFGGPRCCKRDAVASIEVFMRETGYFAGLADHKYFCGQFPKNKDCIRDRCPYYPGGTGHAIW